MTTINEIEFFNLLCSNITHHSNLNIEFSQPTDIDISKIKETNKFKNCKFSGNRLDFYDSTFTDDSKLIHVFEFQGCEFLNDLYFKECVLSLLQFSDSSKTIKNLHIAAKRLGAFHLNQKKKDNLDVVKDINVVFNFCEIDYLGLFHISSKGSFNMRHCSSTRAQFHNCIFEHMNIENNTFSSEFIFMENRLTYTNIKENVFEKSNFTHTDFGVDAIFKANKFNGVAFFEQLKNENRTRVKFVSCNFLKYVYFNKSTLYELHIEESKFHDFASFQDVELNSVYLDRTLFEKTAFFDDIEIFRFNKCSQRTLRNIKQQLLKADNKIDYDNFRAHELNSYKEELKKKIKLKNSDKRKLKRDLWILRINTFYSNNGTDWVKALKRTLFVAVLFYSLFYWSYNSDKELTLFNLQAYNEYFIGLFRYFLLTDFHNPLIEEREYLSSAVEWFPFVLGKIFIAIGIYEILISFRKFKK